MIMLGSARHGHCGYPGDFAEIRAVRGFHSAVLSVFFGTFLRYASLGYFSGFSCSSENFAQIVAGFSTLV